MPDVSVTITPTGYAYQVAREIIDALHRSCPEPSCVDFEPHVTLQLVRGAPNVDVVVAAIEPIGRRTAPFQIKFGTLGSFDQPPGVHVNLVPSEPLVGLYSALKSELDQLGLHTYPYDATTWHPHLTLSCCHWSAEDVAYIRSMFTRLEASFTAERLLVNSMAGNRWTVDRAIDLTGTAGETGGGLAA